MKPVYNLTEYYRAIEDSLKENKTIVLVTVTGVRGSAPGKTGFRMLADDKARIMGTIGGGGGEFHALEKCRELIKKREKYFSERLLLGAGNSLVNDGTNVEKLEALCGGEVSLFYEVFTPVKELYIFGAGHVGQAAERIAVMTGFRCTFIDGRKEILDSIEKQSNTATIEFDLSKLNDSGTERLKLNDNAYVLILTHSHIHDYDVLKFIYTHYPKMKYVGMIGSVKKVRQCLNDLRRDLGEDIDLSNLYSPVGLAIGGETPAEIALGILAEIQAVDNGKYIKHMKLEY
ncbi:MAG: XdhC family protein [Syntrophothermus sp.]